VDEPSRDDGSESIEFADEFDAMLGFRLGRNARFWDRVTAGHGPDSGSRFRSRSPTPITRPHPLPSPSASLWPSPPRFSVRSLSMDGTRFAFASPSPTVQSTARPPDRPCAATSCGLRRPPIQAMSNATASQELAELCHLMCCEPRILKQRFARAGR
jgi:hypothetical protein